MEQEIKTSPDVVVIGSGFAGKTAIVELARERGINIAVVGDMPEYPQHEEVMVIKKRPDLYNHDDEKKLKDKAVEKQEWKRMTYDERKGRKK